MERQDRAAKWDFTWQTSLVDMSTRREDGKTERRRWKEGVSELSQGWSLPFLSNPSPPDTLRYYSIPLYSFHHSCLRVMSVACLSSRTSRSCVSSRNNGEGVLSSVNFIGFRTHESWKCLLALCEISLPRKEFSTKKQTKTTRMILWKESCSPPYQPIVKRIESVTIRRTWKFTKDITALMKPNT